MIFPQLKTGAVMQYPGLRAHQYSTNVAQFLDGSEQRFRERRELTRRWLIRLDLLDDTELAKLEDFFIAARGAASAFEFSDPFDGTVYPNCSFENQEIHTNWISIGNGQVRLIVRHNGN